MRICAVEQAVPATVLDNDAVIDRVLVESRPYLGDDELATVAASLRDLFAACGAERRHLTAGRERPVDLMKASAEKAMRAANVAPQDLDFILYGGVTRGMLVPSTASVVQHLIGARNVTGFDVLDACASWLRAMDVANAMTASGGHKLGLVVSCECGVYHDCDPWPIRSMDNLQQRIGAFTLGEAATATVVEATPDSAADMRFLSRSHGQHGDLAVLPIVDSRHYMAHERQPGERLKFATHSDELTSAGYRAAVAFYKETDPLGGAPVDAFIPHAGAAPSVDAFVRTTKLPHRDLVMTFADFGNTISCSIPLGLSIATADGTIQRGDRVFGMTVAAGITVASVVFTY